MLLPLQAWVYRGQPQVAPVIDALSPAQIVALRQNPHQALHLSYPEELTELPQRWQQWLSERILVPEPLPTLYAYSQTFYRYGETRKPYQRLGIIGLLPTSVPLLPHEATLPIRVEALKQVLQTLPLQATPIHVLAPGAWGEISTLLELYLSCPRFSTSQEGVMHRWSPIHHRGHQAQIQALLHEGPFLIADGHHRWQAIREVGLSHYLVFLSAQEDPSLYIAPTHRFLQGEGKEILLRLEPYFDLRPAAARIPLWAEVQGLRHAIGVVAPDGFSWTARLRPSYWAALQTHPLVHWLHAWVLSEYPDAQIRFSREPVPLVEAAHRGEGWAFLLPPLQLPYVQQAALQGNPLPAKATYFFPKVLSGLCFYHASDISICLA